MRRVAQVQFQTRLIKQQLIRPANTTPYGAGQCISADDDSMFVQEINNDHPPRTGEISSAILKTNANQAAKPDLELWVFRREIATTADGGAFNLSDADLEDLLGVVEFPDTEFKISNANAGVAGNAVCLVPLVGMAFDQRRKDDLWMQLVVRNAYTPVASEQFSLDLLLTLD